MTARLLLSWCSTTVLLAVLMAPRECHAKVFERCELARELRDRHQVPPEQLATWVCIAFRESRFDTKAVGTLAQGKDNGIFQISDLYWCEQGDEGGQCGLNCASLLDDDIADDYKCARRIHRVHQRSQGNGFKAWAVFQTHCSKGRAALEAEYTNDCFGGASVAATSHSYLAAQPNPPIVVAAAPALRIQQAAIYPAPLIPRWWGYHYNTIHYVRK